MTAVKPEPPKPERAMTPVDGRILSRSIEDHWDDTSSCYALGWSDVKLAQHNGVPVDWVREIRERDFGGSGEDPGLVQFLAAQIEIKRDVAGLTSLLDMVGAELSASTAAQNELARKLDGYRNGHRRLFDRVEALTNIAAQLAPKKAGG